jgi:hypothetical protein
MRGDVPGGRAAHRKPANADTVFINRIMAADVIESFE